MKYKILPLYLLGVTDDQIILLRFLSSSLSLFLFFSFCLPRMFISHPLSSFIGSRILPFLLSSRASLSLSLYLSINILFIFSPFLTLTFPLTLIFVSSHSWIQPMNRQLLFVENWMDAFKSAMKWRE